MGAQPMSWVDWEGGSGRDCGRSIELQLTLPGPIIILTGLLCSWEAGWNVVVIQNSSCTSWNRPATWTCFIVAIFIVAVWAFPGELGIGRKVVGILGGPPCRTTSRLRQRQAPLRERGEHRFAMDGLLMGLAEGPLRQGLAEAGWALLPCTRSRQGMAGLQDCPFWDFPEIKMMIGVGGLRLVSFDQSDEGSPPPFWGIFLVSNTWASELQAWQSMSASKDWVAWAPGLVAALKTSMRVYLHRCDRCLDDARRPNKMDVQEWKKHILAQHRPYRRDYRRCLD